jgi:hypothetical protein
LPTHFAISLSFLLVFSYTHESDLPAGLSPFIARWSLDGLPVGVVTKQKVKVKLDFNGLISLVSAQALEELSAEEAAAAAEDKMDVGALPSTVLLIVMTTPVFPLNDVDIHAQVLVGLCLLSREQGGEQRR